MPSTGSEMTSFTMETYATSVLPNTDILSMKVFVAAFLIFIFYLLVSSGSKFKHLKDVPLLNSAKPFFLSSEQARRRFIRSSIQLMTKARKLYPGKPFRMLTDWGEILVLPSNFANEIRNDPRLSFSLAIKQDHHANIPGFDIVEFVGRDDHLLQAVVRKQLTQHLSVMIAPLSKETAYALDINFGSSTEWHEMTLKVAVLDIIARISSRIYLGTQLCRSQEWLRITKNYTTAFYAGSAQLRQFPKVLRPIAHWFLPICYRLRAERTEARRIIYPLIARRQKVKKIAQAAGKPIPKFEDALEWASQECIAKGTTCDVGIFQLTLSLLAIHTTFDLLQQTLLDLAQHPEFIDPIRTEMITVLRAHGWKKTALYHMRLLDSAIKESQRLKPGSIATMRRYTTSDIVLSNGIKVKKGSRVNVDSFRMMDPEVYPEPTKYDAFRFYNMRGQPGCEHMAQLVSTSPDHLGFGHGRHSCPGRFLAANEIKVALCHIMIKYEWDLAEATDILPDTRGMTNKASPLTRIMIRKRETLEIDLDSL